MQWVYSHFRKYLYLLSWLASDEEAEPFWGLNVKYEQSLEVGEERLARHQVYYQTQAHLHACLMSQAH